MKRIFYFAAMALAACTVISCEKEDPIDPGTPGGGDDTTPTKLATPNVKAEVGETEVLVSWEAVANAASYEYTVDNGAATAIEATSVTLAVADLGAGNHTVSVTALPAEGSKDYTKSDAGTCSFNIKEEEGDDPNPPTGNLADWIGTYTATAEKGLLVGTDSEGYITYAETTAPASFEITISENALTDGTPIAVIEGLSLVKFQDGSSPFAAAYVQSDGSLSMGFDISVGTVNATYAGGTTVEMSLIWTPFLLIEGGNEDGSDLITPIYDGVATYVLRNEDGVITLSGGEGSIEGFPYTVLGAEAMGYDANGQLGIFNSSGDVHPAGTITLTKTSNNAPAANFSSNMKFNARANFLMPFSMVK